MSRRRPRAAGEDRHGIADINMRDPTLYRIRHAPHHRTARHGASTRRTTTPTRSPMPSRDHAFALHARVRGSPAAVRLVRRHAEPRRAASSNHARSRSKFARLNLNYTVLSKRKLLVLAQSMGGWDDPRMPTIAGIRRRGYTPEAVRDFCARIGVAKKENVIDIALLEHTVREDLNRRAQRALAVLRPLKS